MITLNTGPGGDSPVFLRIKPPTKDQPGLLEFEIDLLLRQLQRHSFEGHFLLSFLDLNPSIVFVLHFPN